MSVFKSVRACVCSVERDHIARLANYIREIDEVVLRQNDGHHSDHMRMLVSVVNAFLDELEEDGILEEDDDA